MDEREEKEQTVAAEESMAENTEKAAEEVALENAEESVEKIAEEMEKTAKESAEEVAAATEESTEEMADPVTEAPAQKSAGFGSWAAIAGGLVVFFGLLFAMWQMYGGEAAHGVLYAKENAIYYYDLQNEPYLLQEGISDGGFYSIAGSAWGAKQAETGNFVYYPAQIQENGAFTLYRRDVSAPKGEAVLIASNVADYQISADGRTAAYLAIAEDGQTMALGVFQGGKSRVLAENLEWQDNLYALRADGRYLVYYDAYNMLRTQQLDGDKPSVVLTDAAAMFTLGEESGILYYVSQREESYDIYAYDFQKDPTLLAENVTYMEMLPNGRDLLYCKAPEEEILYKDIVVDDMAEADAALTEGDEGYAEKQQRDEIRAAMEEGKGIAPILQEAYVYTGGKSVRMAENVISIMGLAQEAPFAAGYQIKETEPLLLSEIAGGLDMLEMYYYLSLGYGNMETFLADANGSCETLTGYQISPESIQISADGKKAAYLATDETLGGNILMEMKLGKAEDATEIARDIEEFAFLDDALCYAYVKNGTNYLQVGEKFVDNVTAVDFDTEAGKVYFISNANTETGMGEMQSWNGRDAVQKIAENISAYDAIGNGRLALLAEYHREEQDSVGDLLYFDGKSVQTLDTDIAAIFQE